MQVSPQPIYPYLHRAPESVIFFCMQAAEDIVHNARPRHPVIDFRP
jgi:hypothetical protein